MRTRAVLAALVLSLCGMPATHASSVQGERPGDDASVARRRMAEFPTADESIWWLQSRGLRVKAAAQRLASAPDDPGTVRLLMELDRYDEALTVLRRIVDTRPDDMAAAFKALDYHLREMLADAARGRDATVRQIVTDARRRLTTLPKERAAAAAREVVTVEAELDRQPNDWRSHLAAFAAEYAGTEAALLAEVDLLADRDGPQTLVALDAFIEAHAGTSAAAKALYRKGSYLSNNSFSLGERPGADPTDRFFRVLEISRQLRRGSYPPSEWVDKALSLVAEFSSYQPSYAAGNAGRLLSAYEESLPLLLPSYERDFALDPIAFVIRTRMGTLFKVNGDPFTGIEGVFDRLERSAQNPDTVRLLRAELYLRPMDPVFEEKERPALRAKARATLESLVQNGTGFPRRKALATLATLRFGQRDHAAARDLYRKYVDTYPASDYAWVAALRAGQCEEALGNAAGAAEAFRRAAERFASNPVARVLGNAYAARAAEAAGDYRAALAGYQSALGAWDVDYGLTYSLYARRPATPNEPFMTVDDAEVVRDTLPARISELASATAVAGGAQVERGRWLLARGRWDEAIAAFDAFLSQHAGTPLGGEARVLGHRARLERALDLANPEKPGADVKAALAALKALGEEPADFEVAAAKLARATLMFVSGTGGDVAALMADALKTWQSLDTVRPPAAPAGALQRDVVEIRNVVFRPKGGGVFEGDRWNAFTWEGAALPFLTVDPELRVKSSQGETQVVTTYDPFPEFRNVLFLDDGRRQVLEGIMLKIGGTKRGAWTEVMQTPNQPAGASLDVAALWRKSFWTQPGHWGGWVFESYPIITEIEFIDAARTRAAVKVTVGYSGATVQMEKKNGVWIARELTNFWIT